MSALKSVMRVQFDCRMYSQLPGMCDTGCDELGRLDCICRLLKIVTVFRM